MLKAQLQELARFGVRRKLEMYETQLKALYRAFPDEFVGEPVLLKPETKDGGNDWPAFTATAPEGNGNGTTAHDRMSAAAKAAWTPERRAEQSRLVKARYASRKQKNPNPRARKATARKPHRKNIEGAKWGTFVWQRAHDYLKDLPGKKAPVAEITKAAGATSSAAFITGAIDSHGDVFKRIAKGVYGLKKVLDHESQSGTT